MKWSPITGRQRRNKKMSERKPVGKIMIDEDQIRAKAAEIGKMISDKYQGEEIILVGILKGAVMWMAELLKHIDNEQCTIDFMSCSSYGSSTKTSGVVKINKDLDADIQGKHVIIVEDIVDSGVTLTYLKKYLANRGPKSIEICALLDKPCGRKTDLKADYFGFEVGDQFIIGFGLDYAQKYRQLPYISYLEADDEEATAE